MSKAQQSEQGDSEMREEYDFSGGVQGKYAARFSEGSTAVVLDPDVAEVFPDATAVNEALRELIQQGAKGSRRP
jgi:hypothetical protein